ncbi:recombination protein O N-terminal domain-containing protein, partial [Neorhizobium sp. BETTINA12A]
MQWQDEAIIIGVKRHGETSVIAELMTRDRGRHLGLVRSGRSRAMQPVLQAGNRVEAV